MLHKKIFVTGGTGFLGSYLLRYLVDRGYTNIRAIKRATSRMDLVADIQDRIEWVEGDVLDVPFLEEAMENMDLVYHAAAMVSFNPKEAALMLKINEQGTENVVNISLLHSIQKLVHVSSIAAIGKEQYGGLISEKTKWKTDKKNSNYANSKYAAEMQIWRGIAEGLNAAIVNPSLILGSGFWETGSCEIFKVYGNGFPFYAEGTGGFVDVRDVAKTTIQLMESDISRERFILNSENLPYRTVFNSIAAKAKVKAPSIKISPWMTSIGWRLEWLRTQITRQNPTITKETVRSVLDKSAYDNAKSLEVLGMKYTPVEQTLSETMQQFLAAKSDDLSARFLPLN